MPNKELSRRSMLRKTGAIAVGGTLGISALSGIGAAKEAADVNKKGESDGKIIYEVGLFGQTKVLRVRAPDDAGYGVVEVRAPDGGWATVVERFEPFVNRGYDDYGGVKTEWTEDVEKFAELTVGAAMATMAVFVPVSTVATAILTFAGVFAAGVLNNFINTSNFTFGVRESHTFGIAYHFGVIDPNYNESIGGTIPVTEPKSGGIL